MPIRENSSWSLSSAALRNLALLLMFMDHVGAVLLPQQLWLRAVGRLAFPIFAFQIGEGYRHTSNWKSYLGRLLLFALLSEIPFNLLVSGRLWASAHQNVLFTLSLGLLAIAGMEKGRACPSPWKSWLCCVGLPLLCLLAAEWLHTDYGWSGVLMVLGLYLFRKSRPMQLLLMVYLNQFCIRSRTVTLLGLSLHLQLFAVLALPLIWTYNGERGKGWNIGYWFYPLHMLLIAAIALMIQ